MEAAVCSSALAWLSVRALRSWLPWAISALAVATPSEPWRTLVTVETNVVSMESSAPARLSAECDPDVCLRVKSPSATCRAAVMASFSSMPSWPVMLREMSEANTASNSPPIAMDTTLMVRVLLMPASNSAAALSASACRLVALLMMRLSYWSISLSIRSSTTANSLNGASRLVNGR